MFSPGKKIAGFSGEIRNVQCLLLLKWNAALSTEFKSVAHKSQNIGNIGTSDFNIGVESLDIF